MRLPIAALLAVIPLAVPLRALDPAKSLTQYAHRIWGQEEGLFQPTIYSILQSRDGFLWLGTQDSLIRFDGIHFREFEAEVSGLHQTLIHALAEDREGNVWVGSLGAGVARISPAGVLTRFTKKDGLPGDSVFCIDTDAKGGVWICTTDGLARFERGHFHTFTTADGLPSNGIRATCEAADGTRWVAGFDFGLSRIQNGRFVPFDGALGSLRGIDALDCAKDGSLWAGTPTGLIQIRNGIGSPPGARLSARLFTTRDGLPDDAVSAIAEDAEGNVWIGTNDGISRYRNGVFSVYRTRDGLSHSSVLSLAFDREGSLWAGTKDGLDQFADGKLTPYTTEDGMASNEAGPVIEDSSGHLWIGTLDRGLNSFDGDRFRHLTVADGLLSNTILSLEVDREADLWAGTASGLNRLRNGVVVARYTQRDGLAGAQVNALFVDIEGTLWAGTNKGLSRFDGRRFVPDRNPAVARGRQIVALAGGRTVRLFVSTDPADLYYTPAQRSQGIPSGQDTASGHYPLDVLHPVACYYLDHARHAAWMGTLGSGLLRWQNGKVTHVRVKDGLYDNRIYSILLDDRSNFWMASSKGIFRVTQKDLDDFADGKRRAVTSIPFTTGQLRFECRSGVQPAAWRTHDGRLWFSTTSGLVVIDPNHLVTDPVPPPVAITAVLVNGSRALDQRPLDLKPSERNVEIRYAGLSFVSPEKVAFRYMLEGFDKNWTDAGSRREAFFTNLPPGNFRFKVMAQNADGIWSRGAAAIDFTIEPRLYQRVWFFPLMAVLLGCAAFVWYRMRILRLKLRFDLVLAERSRIARELHDTLLQGLAGVTMQLQALWNRMPSSKDKQFLGEIIKDAGACSTAARQSLWGLRTGPEQAHEFSRKLAALARQSAEGKPVALVLDLEPVSLASMPDTEFQLLRIAQEAITNALAHATAETIEIRLQVSKGTLRLAIEDDGIGFETESPAAIGHYGLVGMRERAAEIGAKLTVSSNPRSGACVTIELPLSRSAISDGNVEAPVAHQTK